eukprot:gene21644-28656_t
MLDTIHFISHLYKQRLVTEKMIHNLVVTLLEEETTPRADDIKCLCKLMTTVGGLLDSSSKIESRYAMEVYFTRMTHMKDNKSLGSRIRLMVQDVIDLRQRKWISRIKQEGPKKS